MLASTNRLSARSLPLLLPALALACNDPSGTTASAGQSSTSGTTEPDPTSSTTSEPTGSSSGDVTASGGMSGSSSGDASTTADTTAADTTAADTTGAASTTTSDTTGGTTGTTGGVDELPTDCQDPVGDVALCGADGPPCALKRDELVSDTPLFRNDMPAIALRSDCGPAVLYSEAVGNYKGFYAERTGQGAWTVEMMPSPVATGSLEIDPATDTASAIVDDGAFGVTLWTRSGGMWEMTSALAGQNHVRAPQLLRGPDGELHVGHVDADDNVIHDVFDGSWTKDQLDKSGEIHVRLALGPAAAPRLTYWSSGQGTWRYMFVAPPADPELVTPLGSNVLELHHSALALAGADATPWVLLSRKQADQFHHDVVLLHRVGAAQWTEQTLVGDQPGADKECTSEPGEPGEQCMYDFRRYHPLALLSAGDQLRAVYVEINYKGTLVAECMPMPFPICVWVPLSDESTSELRVAWPESQVDEHQVVATGVFSNRATARLDAGGNMHLALYDYPPGGGDPVVRYLAIGP